jgi:RNA polymerase sigma-70 factor, ECF subfamily
MLETGKIRSLNYVGQIGGAPASLDDVERVMRTYRAKVFAYALRSLHDTDLAETVTQECFLRAFSRRDLYRGDCSLSTWLFTIAANLIRDRTRTIRYQFWKRAYASAVPLSEIEKRLASRELSPEAAVLIREELELVWSAVNSLSERQRVVFRLRFIEEMEISEIAMITGIRMGTVKSYLHRALGAIRKGTEQSRSSRSLRRGARHESARP